MGSPSLAPKTVQLNQNIAASEFACALTSLNRGKPHVAGWPATPKLSFMLGSDKSRGYSLEMICADFLAGAALETDKSIEDPESETSIDCSAATHEPLDLAEKAT